MVSAIRYWYKAFGFLEESDIQWIAKYLFDDTTGKDKYLEDLGTLWLLHFLIVYHNHATLYNTFFTQFQMERQMFSRDHILKFVKRKLTENDLETAFNENTVKRDINVLLQNYCLPKNPQFNEEYSNLFLDLDLIKQNDKKNTGDDNNYFFNIEGKRSVTEDIFLFAVMTAKEEGAQVIDYDDIQKIGLIFCMTDLEIISMLKRLSKKYPEHLACSEHAGIRQLFINKEFDLQQILDNYYDAKN